MLTIKRSNSEKEEQLSDEIYMISNDDHSSSDYKKGALVRKISGVDNSTIPGYHFRCGFSTVCRVDAETAEFCGIKNECLIVQ